MAFVLIWIFATPFGHYWVPVSGSAEFKTIEACEIAKDHIEKSGLIRRNQHVLGCFEKG